MATIQTSIKLTDGMTPALQSMNKALNIVLNSFEHMQKVSGKAIDTKAIQTARSELAKAQVSFNNIEKEINENKIAQEKFNNSVRGGESAANSLWDKIKSIGAAYLGFQSVKSLVSAGDAYTSNVARIDMMNDGLQTTAELQKKIYEASQRSLTNYNDMTDVVAKLGITAGHAFNSTDEIVAFSELLNKQFALAGTGGQEKSAAMYQLTQAMASGKLQGDEFRSILENAPMLAQTIAKHMGMTLGQLREVSSEGKITADVIKNALFSVADETNAKFANMPMTWADLWTQMTNKVNRGLEPLYIKLRDMWNNPKVQQFLDSLVNGFLMVSAAGIHLFEILSNGFALIHNNWDYIEAILIGVATAYLPTIIGLLWAKVTALWSAAAAWIAMNWPILLVIAAIAAVIIIAKKMGVTFGDVCGYIVGALEVVGAAIHNVGVWFNNLWVDARIGFYSFINDVLSKLASLAAKIQPLAELFDIDLSGMINSAQSTISGKITELEGKKQNYTSLSSAWDNGKAKGSGWADNMGNALSGVIDKLGFNVDSPTNNLGALGKVASVSNPTLDKIANNTGKIAGNTSELAASKEDLSYMRDLAEQEAINRYTMTDLKIEMNNNNNINSDMDLDTVVGYLQEKVYEGVLATAEVLHF